MEIILPVLIFSGCVAGLLFIWWENDQNKRKQKGYSRRLSKMKKRNKEEAKQRRKKEEEEGQREAKRVSLMQLGKKEREKREVEKEKVRKAEEAKKWKIRESEKIEKYPQVVSQFNKYVQDFEEFKRNIPNILEQYTNLPNQEDVKSLTNLYVLFSRQFEANGEITSLTYQYSDDDYFLKNHNFDNSTNIHPSHFDEYLYSAFQYLENLAAEDIVSFYEKVLNSGVVDPKAQGIVHILISVLQMQSSLQVPRSAYVSQDFSILDDYLLKILVNSEVWRDFGWCLKGRYGAELRRMVDYHLREAEESLGSVFRRNREDKMVVGLLNQLFSLLNRNNKTSREISYLWSQIEKGNLAENSINQSSTQSLSTVHQGIAFEERCSRLLGAMGFAVTQTSPTSDGGVDLELIDKTPITGGNIIVQCKDWDTTVGVPVVRELLGIVAADGAINKGIVITSGRFTKEAENFAEGTVIDLIDGDTLAGLESEYLT